MKLASITLRYSRMYNKFTELKTGAPMCGNGVRSVFDVPKRVKQVWFTVYDEPGKDRHEMTIRQDLFSYPILRVVSTAGAVHQHEHIKLDDRLRSLAKLGKKLYVGCTYTTE